MFKTTISQTPLTSETANAFFQNIGGAPYMSDCSFLATMRALLAPRISEGHTIWLQFSSSNYRADQINGLPVSDVVGAITRGMELSEHGQFIVHNFRSSEENNLACMKAIDRGFTDKYAGYLRLEKMTTFFKKSFPVTCFVNPDLRNVVIFTESMDIKRMHYLQMSILPAMPWYFNPEAGLAEIEMELIQSLKERTPEKYEACIREIASQYDFRSARIRQMLAGFETRYEKIECDRVRNKIQQTDNEIQRLNDAIGSQYNTRNEYCIKLLGLETKIAQGGDDSEIMEYFLCNNRLYLEQVTNNDMYFCVADYLSYYDQDMIERILQNKGSYVYRSRGGSITPEKMGKLIRAIFIDEVLHIKFCAAYRFDLNGNVSPMAEHAFPMEFDHCMPNTHINNFRCMGNYTKTINDLLRDNNYIGALEQCIASCKSLNFGDSTVMEKFMSILYSNNKSTIELPDGTYVRPAAAIKWLEEQEAANGKKEQEETAHE